MTAVEIVRGLLAAIESRDLRRVAAFLDADCTWQNVPHPPGVGRDGVLAMLAPLLGWADEVRWDVETIMASGTTVVAERADRFFIDGEEFTVLCNGVFEVDLDAGTLLSLRDYVDVGEWRERSGAAFRRLATRPAVDVVTRHLDAVRTGDPVAMAADYALDAVLDRAGDEIHGRMAIADYFDTVPARLGANTLELGSPTVTHDGVEVSWQIVDGAGQTVTSGADSYLVQGGVIARQSVVLDGLDF